MPPSDSASSDLRLNLVDDDALANLEHALDVSELEASVLGHTPKANRLELRLRGTSAVDSLEPCEASDSPTLSITSLLRLFEQMALVLLGDVALDTLFVRVLDLVFEHLPATRGSVCLRDDSTQQLTLRASRVEEGNASRPSLELSRPTAETIMGQNLAVFIRRTAKLDSPEAFSAAGSGGFTLYAPLSHQGTVLGLLFVDCHITPGERGKDSGERDETHLRVLAILGLLVAVAMEQARLHRIATEEQQMRQRLSRYSSPNVVERLITRASDGGSLMEAEEHDVSVLFADLCGFTSMSESMAPAEVATLLNEVFSTLTQVIFRYGGTIDKFNGDAVMAFFGAPLPQDDHAERAVRAAVEMHEVLQTCSQRLSDGPPLRMRIGVNSGKAVVGDIGSIDRMDYTVIGDVVNVAQRLESFVAEPGQVVIGARTRAKLPEQFDCHPLAERYLKGKEKSSRPFLVRSCGQPAPDR